MARSLDRAIHDAYMGYSRNSGYWYRNGSRTLGKLKYMDIPIDKDSFELPVFAINHLRDAVINREENPDVLVATLYTDGKVPAYKSLDRYMRDILISDISEHLIVLEITEHNRNIVYYGTHGAVFDENFHPLMMCSWMVNKKIEGDKVRYYFDTPILRLHRSVFINQSDPIQRFLSKKLLSTSLANNIFEPPCSYSYSANYKKIKVIIDDIPFNIKTIEVPTISTTNDQLLQVALDNISEMNL